MKHKFSNPKRTREAISQRAQKLEWKDLPIAKRIQILEHVSQAIEEAIREAQ